MSRAGVNDWLGLGALIGLWGTSFLFIALSLQHFSPVGVVALRVSLAAIVLTLYMYAKGLRLPRWGRSWLIFAVFSVFGNLLPFYLISWGQQNVSSGIAGLLMAIMPLATMVLAHYLLVGESLNRFKVAGFCLGISGVVIILWPSLLGGHSTLLSSMLILLAAVSYSLNSVLVRRLPGHDPKVAGAGVMIVASLMIVPVWLWQDRPWQVSYPLEALLPLVWLGVGPTGMATLIYFSVVARSGPTFLSYINYFIPVVAYFTGALVLHEAVEWHSMAALLLIIGGIALTRRIPPLRPLRQHPS
ncbi:MAG: DMT family transporter [Thiolinea sp.]